MAISKGNPGHKDNGTKTNSKKNINVMLLGAPGTGKTALITSYLFNIFPGHHTPTLDNVFSGVSHHDPPRPLTILEPGCAGDPALLQLRLQDTDVFVIVFSVVDKRSFEEAEMKWVPQADTKKPMVLVGCKKDLRPPTVSVNEAVRTEVLEGEGVRMSWKIKAKAYVECSALTEEGLMEVFGAVVYAAEGGKVGDGKRCPG